MSPKSLLRHPMAVCNVDELGNGKYHPFIDTGSDSKDSIERLIICSGKVYYDILKEMEASEDKNLNERVGVARLEQFYPFPNNDIKQALETYTNLKEIVWCQEEPQNMGGWTFVSPRLQKLLSDEQSLTYTGRQASASPAAGQKKIHEAEQSKLIEKAIGK
jgi:2-oxoglutarate dehydrogenase E1 component